MFNPYPGPMQPWPALAPHARRAQLPGFGTLFYYEAGPAEAPPLLLIHGLGDEADTWRHILPPLAARRRVLAVDLPGFGRSDKPRRDYSLPFLRDTILQLMDHAGLQTAALMGHSLGAVIAQSMALAQPGRVTELTLVGGSITSRAARLNSAILLMALPVVGARIYNGLRANPQAAYDSLRPFYASLDDLPKEDRKFLYQRVNERVWSDGQRDAFLSILRHLVWTAPRQQAALEKQLAQLATPTHAIWGEQDVINSVESGRALAALQPAARLTVIPGAGHDVHQEAPRVVVELVGDV